MRPLHSTPDRAPSCTARRRGKLLGRNQRTKSLRYPVRYQRSKIEIRSKSIVTLRQSAHRQRWAGCYVVTINSVYKPGPPHPTKHQCTTSVRALLM